MVLKGAKIYKIVNSDGLVYYGSTCRTLYNRLKRHKEAYKYWFYNYSSFCYSFVVMHNQKFKIDLVERCKVENKQGLKERERFYIENNTCTNHNIPARSRKETYTAYNQTPHRKEELQRYYQLNKDKIKQKQKEKKKSKLLS